MRNQAAVVLLMRAIETCLDDFFAERIEFRHEKLLEFPGKELPPLARALFVDIHTALNLLFHSEKHARNHGALNPQLVRDVAKQRTDCLAHLLAGKLGAAAAGEVFARNPLCHEAYLPDTDVLVWQEHIAGVRRIDDLTEQQVGLVNAAAGSEGPIRAHALRLHLF